jgi:hypothetical protein
MRTASTPAAPRVDAGLFCIGLASHGESNGHVRSNANDKIGRRAACNDVLPGTSAQSLIGIIAVKAADRTCSIDAGGAPGWLDIK